MGCSSNKKLFHKCLCSDGQPFLSEAPSHLHKHLLASEHRFACSCLRQSDWKAGGYRGSDGQGGSLGKQLRRVLTVEKVNNKLHHCRDMTGRTSDPTSQYLQSCQRAG